MRLDAGLSLRPLGEHQPSGSEVGVAQCISSITSSKAGVNLDVVKEVGSTSLARICIDAPLQLLAPATRQKSVVCRVDSDQRSPQNQRGCRCQPGNRFAKPCRMTSTCRHIPVGKFTVMLNTTPAALKSPLQDYNIRRT